MDLEADAVPERMAERLAVACLADDGARGLVQLCARDPRTRHRAGDVLRRADDLVDLAHLARRLPDADGAGHVAVIAVDDRAEVHQHEVAPPDLAVVRDAVGHGRVCAGQRDGLEGQVLRPVTAHVEVEEERDVPLRHARMELLEERREGVLGELLGGLDALELRRALDGPQGVEGVAQGRVREEFDALDPFEDGRALERQAHGLHRAGPGAVRLHDGRELPEDGVLLLDDGAVADDLARPLDVARVDDEDGLVLKDEHIARGGLHAGQVAPVDVIGDEGAVGLALQQRAQACDPFLHHCTSISASARTARS